jgi:hypothetical protein
MKTFKRVTIAVTASAIALADLLLLAALDPVAVIANLAVLALAVALLYERGVYRRRKAVAWFHRHGIDDRARDNAAIPWYVWAGDWLQDTRELIDRRWTP